MRLFVWPDRHAVRGCTRLMCAQMLIVDAKVGRDTLSGTVANGRIYNERRLLLAADYLLDGLLSGKAESKQQEQAPRATKVDS